MSKIHQAIRRAERELNEVRSQQQPITSSGTETGETKRKAPFDLDSARFSPAHREVESRVKEPYVPIFDQEVEIVADSELIALTAPDSEAALQYRELGQKVTQVGVEQGLKTLLITSASNSEGRTLISANLSIELARQSGHRVLLVDADLRNPSIHRILGISQSTGLVELLKSGRSVGESILTTNVTNLTVLPSGGEVESPTELLNTRSMQDFLTGAKERFDWVIIDSPPVLPYADAELMSVLVDGVVLVVQANKTPAHLLEEATRRLRGCNVLGVVLNDFERRTS